MSLPKAWLALMIAVLGAATPALCQSVPARQQLNADEIRRSLTGKMIGYSPQGWADAGMDEQFHKDGKWRGIYLSRGPIDFSGRWSIEANQLCVVADKGSIAEKWHRGKYCRPVWKDRRTGKLLLEHLTGHHDELQTLTVLDLATLR